MRRGVYRIVHVPAGEHEDLAAIWLWAEKAAVFSHETALMLHPLSDALPSNAHLTLPLAWQTRRLRIPKGVRIHFAEIPSEDRVELSAIPLTSVRRTLADSIDARVSPELLEAALRQAVLRGLLSRAEEKVMRARARRA